MTTKAKLEGNKRHLAKLDDIKVRVPKGMRERYKTHAEQKGMSLNAYIINLIETDMKKQGKEV